MLRILLFLQTLHRDPNFSCKYQSWPCAGRKWLTMVTPYTPRHTATLGRTLALTLFSKAPFMPSGLASGPFAKAGYFPTAVVIGFDMFGSSKF
uniref:Uncharacterized protein n=1 Tax=Ciona intestinalis TaxID=7719 RepID=F6Z210_CIOIN